MPTHVYANCNEVASKAADGKSIAAFPDVCFSPPAPPVGPMPLPYPNTGEVKDTDQGTAKVFVKDKMSGMAGDSHMTKSMGDEPATKSYSKGLITGALQGKCYFKLWSMDVNMEGKGVPRHLDMVTHNHASESGTCLCYYIAGFTFQSLFQNLVALTGSNNSKKKKVAVKAVILRSTNHIVPEQGTPGVLIITKHIYDSQNTITTKKFYTLELPWRNNYSKISCIMEGIYKCKISKSNSATLSKFNNGCYYRVEDKNSRSGVLIHAGNYAGDKNYKSNLKSQNNDEYNEYVKTYGEEPYKSNIEGCILVGNGYSEANGKVQRSIIDTRNAVVQMQNFLKVQDDESIEAASMFNGVYFHDFDLEIKTNKAESTENDNKENYQMKINKPLIA